MSDVILLLPHYNNLEGLKRSIRSVNVEYKLVDLLIIDDGSKEILNRVELETLYKGKLFVILNNENRGIEHVLNDGIGFAIENNYKYIARLDCGDIVVNERFEKQYKFLEDNKDIAMVGSHVECVDTEGNYLYKLCMPLDNNTIKKKMFLNAMLIHPTIFFRTSVVLKEGGYPVEYKSAEDYAFFFKLLKKYDFANLNEFLVQIEINDKGISAIHRKRQVKNRIKLIKENFYFGIYPLYGLIRSYILLFLPKEVILKIKKYVK